MSGMSLDTPENTESIKLAVWALDHLRPDRSSGEICELTVFLAVDDLLLPSRAAVRLHQVTASPAHGPTFGVYMIEVDGQLLGFDGERSWEEATVAACKDKGRCLLSEPAIRPADKLPLHYHARAQALAPRLHAALDGKILDQNTPTPTTAPRARL